MLNLPALVRTAFRTAQALGGVVGSATITRPSGLTINPTTNEATGSAVAQTLTDVVELEGTSYRMRGGAWTEASALLMVSWASLAWEPVKGDIVTWGGIDMRIGVTEITRPDGATPLFMVLAIGGSAV